MVELLAAEAAALAAFPAAMNAFTALMSFASVTTLLEKTSSRARTLKKRMALRPMKTSVR
jgi:hypothetical protein